MGRLGRCRFSRLGLNCQFLEAGQSPLLARRRRSRTLNRCRYQLSVSVNTRPRAGTPIRVAVSRHEGVYRDTLNGDRQLVSVQDSARPDTTPFLPVGIRINVIFRLRREAGGGPKAKAHFQETRVQATPNQARYVIHFQFPLASTAAEKNAGFIYLMQMKHVGKVASASRYDHGNGVMWASIELQFKGHNSFSDAALDCRKYIGSSGRVLKAAEGPMQGADPGGLGAKSLLKKV